MYNVSLLFRQHILKKVRIRKLTILLVFCKCALKSKNSQFNQPAFTNNFVFFFKSFFFLLFFTFGLGEVIKITSPSIFVPTSPSSFFCICVIILLEDKLKKKTGNGTQGKHETEESYIEYVYEEKVLNHKWCITFFT